MENESKQRKILNMIFLFISFFFSQIKGKAFEERYEFHVSRIKLTNKDKHQLFKMKNVCQKFLVWNSAFLSANRKLIFIHNFLFFCFFLFALGMRCQFMSWIFFFGLAWVNHGAADVTFVCVQRCPESTSALN